MAKSTKGPRRPKIRAVVAVARPTVVRRVVHHVHHAAPSMLAMRPRGAAPLGIAPRPLVPPAAPTMAPPARPMPPAFRTPPVMAPGVAPLGVPRVAPVGAPPIGPVAPRAPLPGAMGPMGPFGPRRF